MLAAMHGKICCVKRLLRAGANVYQSSKFFFFVIYYSFMTMELNIMWLIYENFQILMFDSIFGRTCLHYAAYYGHADCLQAILAAAESSPIAVSW